MRVHILLIVFLLGCSDVLAQPEWKPAIRFSKSLGRATYIPNLGPAGAVQFDHGPDGVADGIYDVATLSDTSKVLEQLAGTISQVGGINYIRDFDNNGLFDAVTDFELYVDVGHPSQRKIALTNGMGFSIGYSDIDGDGVNETTGDYAYGGGVVTKFSTDFTSFRNYGLPYTPQYLGTLSGRPRFLHYHKVDWSPPFMRLSLDSLDPATLHPDSTIRMHTVTYIDYKPNVDVLPQRIFTFNDVWYVDKGPEMCVVTNDTIRTIPLDTSLGLSPGNHWGRFRGRGVTYEFVDGEKTGLYLHGTPTRLAYVRYRGENDRFRAEEVASMYVTLTNGSTAGACEATVILGDIDHDGLDDIYVNYGEDGKYESMLYLTTGRTASAVQENGAPPLVIARRTQSGWEIPAVTQVPLPNQAYVYNVRGELVGTTLVQPLSPSKFLIRELPLPAGLHIAVIGQSTYRLQ
ncbi:MAG: hypothetical protein HQ472_03910 [Ignavibacteria bacterium]|nr:hypothetical protein [Ignavibacteria bacterium]